MENKMTEVILDEEVQEVFEDLQSCFENFNGFEVHRVVDTELKDYYGNTFRNEKFIITDENNCKNSDDPLNVAVYIKEDYTLWVHRYEDIFEEVDAHYTQVWQELYFESSRQTY